MQAVPLATHFRDYYTEMYVVFAGIMGVGRVQELPAERGQFHLLRLLEYRMARRLRHRLQRALPRDKEWVRLVIPWRPWLRA